MRLDVEHLNRVRVLKGYTVTDVAALAKRPYQRICKVFSGKSASPKTVKAICEVLEINTEDAWRN